MAATDKLKPSSLVSGNCFGIFAPASPVRSEFVERGRRWLREAGFGSRVGQHLFRRRYHVAGSLEERRADFENLLTDDRVRALVAARGGYGCLPLLERIDYGLVSRHPKIILGFSDVTALQLALWRKIRLVTFSGPMLAMAMARSGTVNDELLWALLRGGEPSLVSALCSRYLQTPEIEFIRPGDFSGEVLGGTLTILSSLVGTPYMPDFTDRIIFIEDCGEPLYRIDRALTQLRLAGLFKDPAAVVCGDFSNLRPNEAGMLPAFFREFFAGDGFPVVLNFRYGHCPQSFILPQGVRMQFACQSREIVMSESAVERHGG